MDNIPNYLNADGTILNYLNLDESNELLKLLTSWGMPNLLDRFLAHDVDVESLKVITEAELIELIPASLGTRAKVRAKILAWRLQNKLPNVSSLNKTEGVVVDWLQNNCEASWLSVSPSTSNQHTLHTSFSLDYYLKNNTKYKSAYDQNNILPGFIREELIEGVIKGCIDLNIRLKHHDFIDLRDQIIQIFENEPKDVYYNSYTRTGRLFSVYKTKIAKLRKFGFIEPEKKRKLILSAEVYDPTITNPSEDHKWLKNHLTPFATIEMKWTATSETRAEQISKSCDSTITNIIGDWPPYILPDGPRLIDIDFIFKYPQKDLILLEKWPDFCRKIYPIIKNKIKDKFSIQQLQNLQFCSKGNQYDITISLLLHAIFSPGGHVKEKNSKKTWKFSIADSQKAFILRLENSAAFHEEIKNRKKNYADYNMRMQPFMVVVGNEDYSTINNIQVVYDNIIYSFDSFIKALSCTFKIHYVFNLNYQKECQAVWQFLQLYIFDILDEKICTNVSQILALLNNK